MRRATPDGVYVVAYRILRGALGVALALVLAGCSEQVTGSLGCPELCTDQSAQLRDTVLTGAVVLDTTFTGFPRLGAASTFTLVAQGDTADVRLVARFDTLPNLYRPTGATADSTVSRVDSATLVLVIDTTFAKPTVPVRIEAFDVDTTAADTLTTALLPLFRADRLLGARTFAVAEITDTLRLPISDARILSKIASTSRLRIGLRLSSTTGAGVRLRINRLAAPIVRYRVSADTLVAPDTLRLYSKTPADIPSVAAGLQIYPVIAGGQLPIPANTILAVGGLGGARAYLQFTIPPIVLDSVQVIRATLGITQRPSRSPGGVADTINLVVNPVIAGPSITDLFTASQFIGSPVGFGIDTLKLVPRDSGRREIEIVQLVRSWRAIGTTNTNRAIVLRATEEGESAGELDFFSFRAAANLRPTLRLTYVPRRGFGLP
jgi:hypothetical protein